MANEKTAALAAQILTAFEAGTVPQFLAPAFLINQNSPMARWSWNNRFLAMLAGAPDARGFRQWLEVGRQVKRGARAFYIFAPLIRKSVSRDEETGEETAVHHQPRGFFAIPVFSLNDTEPANNVEQTFPQAQRFLDRLPLRDVAAAWGIKIEAIPRNDFFRGFFSREDLTIGLASDSVRGWTHELIHAADYRRGALTQPGPEAEVVAELGAATLRVFLGLESETEHNNAHAYLAATAKTPAEAFALASKLLERTAAAVQLVLSTAEELANQRATELAA